MSADGTSQIYKTVGVIGHIDHGKTALVGKLTGIDTDSHPEEKRRGITIDLGFAPLSEAGYTFAFIDAPGHQKYIGNLLAGVSAVDIGLLVVACDQGIQAQTLEHVSVLGTLGVPQLVVALSRVDLCNLDRREEIAEELQVFLSDFGFTDFPIIPTSAVTGEGLSELKAALRLAAGQAHHQAGRVFRSAPRSQDASVAEEEQAFFRMPIDRVLNVAGRGLVVAGTVWAGQVRVGDKLQIAGRQNELRVREIEVHGESVSESSLSRRTAVNLAGGAADEISRGDELISPNAYRLSQRLLVDLQMFPESKELRLPASVQLHTATTAVGTKILGAKRLPPGQRDVVIVQPERPLLATYGQACLFRLPYPVGSFAGGKVLALADGLVGKGRRTSNRDLIELGKNLLADDPVEQILAWVRLVGELPIDPDWFRQQLGISPGELQSLVQRVSEDASVSRMGDSLVDVGLLDATGKFIVKCLVTKAEAEDNAWSVEDSIVERCAHLAGPEVARRAIERLIESDAIVRLNSMLAVASEKTQLSKKQRAKMDQMLRLFEGNASPPSVKELAQELSLSQQAVESLARHATQQALLVQLGHGFYLSNAVFADMVARLGEQFESQAEMAVPQIKDLWGLTRKHVIPILEYCDRRQITQRQGDARIAGPSLSTYMQPKSGEKVEEEL